MNQNESLSPKLNIAVVSKRFYFRHKNNKMKYIILERNQLYTVGYMIKTKKWFWSKSKEEFRCTYNLGLPAHFNTIYGAREFIKKITNKTENYYNSDGDVILVHNDSDNLLSILIRAFTKSKWKKN